MRDPARIKPLMAKLANMWQQYVKRDEGDANERNLEISADC